jgi:hypothetical protein
MQEKLQLYHLQQLTSQLGAAEVHGSEDCCILVALGL